LKLIRRVGVYRMKISHAIFNLVGVFPIRDHYYEPMFNPKYFHHPLSQDRKLNGIDWNVEEQLSVLAQFHFNSDLKKIPIQKTDEFSFYYDNPNFLPGDAEFFYNLIRLYKPSRITEIGSGMSTLLAQSAIRDCKKEDQNYAPKHICIEPFEMAWLENVGNIEIIRQLVEEIDKSIFAELSVNDILFIDSSHMIRPQGDVLVEYLEILPLLQSGVLIQVHDIFSPRDYPKKWLVEQVRFWNEQYLLEAFLSCNTEFAIIGALNYLKHHYPQEFEEKCPIYGQRPHAFNPGSFWFRKK